MTTKPGSKIWFVEHSESNDDWQSRDENPLGVCQNCADPLCGGSCERGLGNSLAIAGIAGAGAITLVALLRIALR